MEVFWELAGDAKFGAGLATGLLILGIGWLIFRGVPRYRQRSVTLALPFGLGSVTYDISEDEREAAWRLFVQLKTRKAAIPFDHENDLVVEVLDSLYELVDITRELLTGLPVSSSKSIGLSDLMLRVLNDGLRPFLTRWQADFRRWWESAVQDPANGRERPQTIQRAYPLYGELVEGIVEMNQQLDEYAEDLLSVARSRPKVTWPRRRPQAIRPSGGDENGL